MSAKITMDFISLPIEGWELKEDTKYNKFWINQSHGDVLRVDILSMPSDVVLKDADALMKEYRTSIYEGKGAIVELERDHLDTKFAVRVLSKYKQEPSGLFFVGTYTIPLKESSIIVKTVCRERGATGIRESVILG